jgi:glycyl-tRNA synthetase beta chain
MKKSDFLFELGVEELPAGYIANALDKFKQSIEQDCVQYKIQFESIKTFSTPRRLTVKVLQMDTLQQDETIKKMGPAKSVAFDTNNNLTKAGQGFLNGAGATEKDIIIKETEKGEYIAVKIFIKGKETKELLPIMMKSAIEKIVFPKNMKWGSHKFMFARPIRWIVALFDNDVIDFEFCDVKAGKTTYGNRFVDLNNSVDINNISEYPDVLKSVKVYADREERKQIIIQQLQKFNVVKDDRLIDTVTDLVEFPTAVKANFDEKYLMLPSKIITSTLSQNQKYFTIEASDNKLKSEFVFISNGNPEFSDIIKIGNEKVVKARLEDASFYYQEDTKKKLDEYALKLCDVVFHAKLGTLRDKTDRIKSICEFMIDKLQIGEPEKNHILRAAELCKADLVTLMLGEKEFTKLQGYIGMNYALIQNEPETVANAIYEHYMPRGQNDTLPSDLVGAIVAIADKLDTVCGIIIIGLMPTGSQDPFAIRRNATGIIQILDKFNLEINMKDLILKGMELLKDKITDGNIKDKIIDYVKQRIKWLLEQKGIEYDVLDSIETMQWDYIVKIKSRAENLQSFKTKKEFETLVAGFKRVSNIVQKNQTNNTPDISLFTELAEKHLYNHFMELKSQTDELISKMEYGQAMEKLVSIGVHIDHFFDNIMVMCDDKIQRENRLALLNDIRNHFLQIADISKINYEKNS